MTAPRIFAALVVLAFYGIGFVSTDSPLYMIGGLVLLVGLGVLGYGILHPARR